MSGAAELEGCGIGFDADPTPDELIPWFALFASVLGDPVAIEVRAEEWRELFGGARA